MDANVAISGLQEDSAKLLVLIQDICEVNKD
jgi:hypothetical protein